MFLTTFRPPDHFPRGLELQGFGQNLASGGGLELQVFGREAPENGAEGAVLENFSDFSAESGPESVETA